MPLALLMVAISSRIHADTIYLVSGEKLVGRVKEEGRDKVEIESVALGHLQIPRERIDRIEWDPATIAAPSDGLAHTPFVPSSPLGPGTTNAPLASFPAKETSSDWIQLKSGEWLRGRLYGMQNRKLEFDSDELDDLVFDWKDIYQVVAPKALVSYGDRSRAWGSVRVDRETVTVSGIEEVEFPRYDLVGIAPGSPRERDYWSGKFNLGLNVRAGNTEQADLVTKFKLERRTPNTHLKLEYLGNYSKLNGEESINNHRGSEFFDTFLTRRLFVRLPQSEYYHDPFQNIDYRITAGGGFGYYLIDKPKVEWLIAGGPAYQLVRFDTVQPGEDPNRSTPAVLAQTTGEIELTKRIDLDLGYQAILANQDSGGNIHHGVLSLEIDLTHSLDLDISLIWDRIGSPEVDASGHEPEKDDFRLNLSVGVTF